jgi:hypothetical protein
LGYSDAVIFRHAQAAALPFQRYAALIVELQAHKPQGAES